MNEVVDMKSSGALAAVRALKGNLKRVQMQLPDTQGAPYLRFLQDGNWVFGQDNEEVLTEDLAAINTLSIRTGWSCWTDRPGKGVKNENLGESMVPLGSDPLTRETLPVHRDPKNNNAVCEWRAQISADVKFLSGPHKGTQVHYKTTSIGGINAMRVLVDQIILQVDEDPGNIVPVVHLDGDHYNHKAYGRTYTPVFRVVDWIPMDGPAPVAVAGVIEEKPLATPVADDVIDDGEGAEEPRRRRRR